MGDLAEKGAAIHEAAEAALGDKLTEPCDPDKIQGVETGRSYKHNCRTGCGSCKPITVTAETKNGIKKFDFAGLPRTVRRHLMRKYIKAWMLRNNFTKKKLRRELEGAGLTGKLSLRKLFDIAVGVGDNEDDIEEDINEEGPTSVAGECATDRGNGAEAMSSSMEVVKSPSREE